QIGPRIIPNSGGQEATFLPPGSPCRPFVATVAVPQGHGVDSTAADERGDNFRDSAAESVASARADTTSTDLPGGGRIQLEMPQRVVDAEGSRDGPRPSPGWVGG